MRHPYSKGLSRTLVAAVAASVLIFLAAGAFPAPESSAPSQDVHDQIIHAYMTSEWPALDKMLHDRIQEIAALRRAQAADVAAIRRALVECRPAWWAGVKRGRETIIHPALFGRSFSAVYDPGCKSSMQLAVTNDIATLTVNWPAADMDSDKPGEHGFTKGDITDLTVFATLGSIDSWSMLPPAEMQLTEGGKMALARYIDFRGNLAGVAYTTPGGRRWALWLFLDSYNARFAKMPTRMGREALGAFFIAEILGHPQTYASIELPRKLAPENAEAALAKSLLPVLEKHAWTFAEDEALRFAAKSFANANGPKCYTTQLVILPNHLTLSLDPEKDKSLKGQRDAWVKAAFDKLRNLGK